MARKNETWCGIERDRIGWFPTIDYSKCMRCMKCVARCGNGVYAEIKGKPMVVKPKKCVVGCTGCEPICPVGAISHPPMGYLEKLSGKKHTVLKCGCGPGM